MNITLSITWTQSDVQNAVTDTTTITLSGAPAEIQAAIDQMFNAEQGAALRERLGLQVPVSEFGAFASSAARFAEAVDCLDQATLQYAPAPQP